MKHRTIANAPDATSKDRVFKLHTIAVVHNCDVGATVAAFTDFSKDFLF
jgi:hypothetical protein